MVIVLLVAAMSARHLLMLLYGHIQPLYEYLASALPFAVAIPWLAQIVALVLVIALISAALWTLGGVSPSDLLKTFARWRVARAQARLEETLHQHGEKILYGARIRKESFFGGYPIGIVTKLYVKKGRRFCNVCFPNLGGFITVPVPAEDIECVEESIEEILLLYISGGML